MATFKTAFSCSMYFGPISSAHWREKTLGDALARVFQDGTFYLNNDHERETYARVMEVCDHCDGSGEVSWANGRRCKTKRCPECRGNAVLFDSGLVRLQLHDNVLADRVAVEG